MSDLEKLKDKKITKPEQISVIGGYQHIQTDQPSDCTDPSGHIFDDHDDMPIE